MKHHPSFYVTCVLAVCVFAVFAVVLTMGGHGVGPSLGGY